MNVVVDLDRLFECPYLDDRQHRAEDFFLGDAHIGPNVIKQRWHVEITLAAVLAFARDLATTQHPCALLLPNLDVFMDGLAGALVDHRANVH